MSRASKEQVRTDKHSILSKHYVYVGNGMYEKRAVMDVTPTIVDALKKNSPKDKVLFLKLWMFWRSASPYLKAVTGFCVGLLCGALAGIFALVMVACCVPFAIAKEGLKGKWFWEVKSAEL